jgi:imidazolonepropionase-like amidohydrolase
MLVLHGGRVCDGNGAPAPGTVVVADGKLRELLPAEAPLPPGPSRRIDARGKVIVPGLIDAHTHLLLSGGGIDGYLQELVEVSLPLRTLRAAAHARDALDHGFVVMRDVCTEGAAYADVALRDAIGAGLCEGPRVVPSGPGMGITGGYLPMGVAPGVCVPSGCSIVDSPDAARREVRLQVSHGVEWIKVFADWSDHRPGGSDAVLPTFTGAELEAIVDEARRRGVRVAAHATSDAGARHAVRCGVASIEHLGDLSRETLDLAAAGEVTLVPTLSVMLHARDGSTGERRERQQRRFDLTAAAFERALASGVRIACGTDIGCFPHASGSLGELGAMVDLGMSAERALFAATGAGAALLQMPERGRLAPGAIADLAVFELAEGEDLAAAWRARPALVIQAGRVVRNQAGDQADGAGRR